MQKPFFIMTAIMTGIFLASIDSLVVGTAMPTVIRELGGLRLYSWVFNAYILASALTMPIFGRLSDIYPKQYIYAICVGIFLLGSALCGLSRSIIELVLFRGVQGLGAGGMFSVPFAIIGTVFKPAERGRMIGYTSTVWGVSSILGPALGSLIVTQFSWRWVFYVNLPFGIAAITMFFLVYREYEKKKPVKMDYAGIIVLGSAITLVLLAFLSISRDLAINTLNVLALSAGFGLFYFFYAVEKKTDDPLVAARILTESGFLFPNLCAFLSGAVLFSSIVFIPFFVQTLTQGSAIQAGGVLMPISFAWSGTSVILGHFIGRLRLRVPAAAGFAAIGLGLSGYLIASSLTPYWVYVASGIIIGIGAGLVTPTLLVAVQNSSHHREIGAVTSSQQLFNRIGGIMGIGVTGAMFSMLFFHYTGHNPELSNLMDGMVQTGGAVHSGITGNSAEAVSHFVRSLKGAFMLNILTAILGAVMAFFIPGSGGKDMKGAATPELAA